MAFNKYCIFVITDGGTRGFIYHWEQIDCLCISIFITIKHIYGLVIEMNRHCAVCTKPGNGKSGKTTRETKSFTRDH